MAVKIQVYMKTNRVFEYEVSDFGKAREHAKRIVTEGYTNWEEDGLVYYPLEQVFKVKILDYPQGKYVAKDISL